MRYQLLLDVHRILLEYRIGSVLPADHHALGEARQVQVVLPLLILLVLLLQLELLARV